MHRVGESLHAAQHRSGKPIRTFRQNIDVKHIAFENDLVERVGHVVDYLHKPENVLLIYRGYEFCRKPREDIVVYTVGLMLDRVDVFAVKGGFGGGIVAEDAFEQHGGSNAV